MPMSAACRDLWGRLLAERDARDRAARDVVSALKTSSAANERWSGASERFTALDARLRTANGRLQGSLPDIDAALNSEEDAYAAWNQTGDPIPWEDPISWDKVERATELADRARDLLDRYRNEIAELELLVGDANAALDDATQEAFAAIARYIDADTRWRSARDGVKRLLEEYRANCGEGWTLALLLTWQSQEQVNYPGGEDACYHNYEFVLSWYEPANGSTERKETRWTEWVRVTVDRSHLAWSGSKDITVNLDHRPSADELAQLARRDSGLEFRAPPEPR